MTKAIWKYPLEFGVRQTIKMPAHARALAVGYQDRQLTLWAMVDPGWAPVPRIVRVVGTGWEFEPQVDRLEYVGTAQSATGLVAHVYVEATR